MGAYRFVKTAMWQDLFFFALSPYDKLFHSYMITNSKTTQCGIFEQSISIMALELGYGEDIVLDQIKRFEEWDKILYDPNTHEFLLLSWLKHNFRSSPNVITCIENEMKKVKSHLLIKSWKDLASPLHIPCHKVNCNCKVNLNLKDN
jgi:hypothetical protein